MTHARSGHLYHLRAPKLVRTFLVSRGVSVPLSSSAAAMAAAAAAADAVEARPFFFLLFPFLSAVADVGVGWFDPPSLSLPLLVKVVDTGVGAPGVEVEERASLASGCWSDGERGADWSARGNPTL